MILAVKLQHKQNHESTTTILVKFNHMFYKYCVWRNNDTLIVN